MTDEAPPPWAELNLARRRRTPVVMAAEGAECGLACMTMIAAHWGCDVDLNGLRQRFPLSLQGATLNGLMVIADQLGLTTRAVRVDLEAIDELDLPAILHWDFNHFVVLTALRKGHAVIHDPASGRRVLPFSEVSNAFTGVALEVEPAASFKPIAAKAPTRLWSLWSKFDGLPTALAQVIGLSLALQLLVFAAPFQLQLAVDEAIYSGDANLAVILALGFGALVGLQAIVEALRGWTLQYFGHLLTFQMTGNLVRHLLRLPVGFFEKRSVGDVISRIESVEPIEKAVTTGLAATLIDGVMAIIALVIMAVYAPQLALVVAGFMAASLLVSFGLFPLLRARTEEQIIAKAKEQTNVMESVRAATTVKLMGREAERESVWRNLYADTINAGFSIAKVQVGWQFAQTLLSGLQAVIVIYLASMMIIRAEGFSVGMLVAFLAFRQIFTDRTNALISQVMQFRLLGLHLDRLGDIVQTPADASAPAALQAEMAGGIAFEGVSFAYGSLDPYVIETISFRINPGEFVAITGPSGSGKSTLLKLLLGLYPPTEGSILLDGRAVPPGGWAAWRAHVGVVAQDDQLLSGTLADNIAFFDPNLDMERVRAAAIASEVHEDIINTPMQYLSLVGDMGSALSGGQRQRVLLARALYRKPRLLILDEGTANLDPETEDKIANLLEAMPITRIVVAHRPALIARAQRVFEVRDGALQELGA